MPHDMKRHQIAGSDSSALVMRKLITREILSSETAPSLTWTQDDGGNPLSLDNAEIRIFVPANTLAVGSSAYIYGRVNDVAEGYYFVSSDTGTAFEAGVFKSVFGASTCFIRKIGTRLQFWVQGQYTDGTTRASVSRGTFGNFAVSKINKLHLYVSGLTNFPSGTIVEVYGR